MPVVHVVSQRGNEQVWSFLGDELPTLRAGRERDPYMEQSCHPDIVVRVWDQLGKGLPVDCRAQAKGRPVLAHPETDRMFAIAHGTAYALWLAPEDFIDAVHKGASTIMKWSGGAITDLHTHAGEGWIWGKWYKDEPAWVSRAYDRAAASNPAL